jgi:ribosomal-protein-alanine N-acetyltransferase
MKMKISSVLLEGERIVLKNIEKDDIDRIFDLVRKYPDIDKFFPMSLISEMVIKTHFEAGDSTGNINDICLLISDKQGNIIGSIAYFKGWQCDKNSQELAYHIFRPVHRGKGYMTEALCLLTTYLFETVKIPRLQINIIKGNITSRKVAEKCGFTFDGTVRRAPQPGEKPEVIEMFSLVREGYMK